MSTDRELTELLREIQAGDEADDLLDNQMLSLVLDWPLESVAACLRDAKARSFIWGTAGRGGPPPWFSELEVTVQGRRFLDRNSGSGLQSEPAG